MKITNYLNNRFLVLLFSNAFILCMHAQTYIKGTVRNNKMKAVGEVIVRIVLNERLLAYDITDKNGNYSCKISENDNTAKIVFSKLGYATVQLPVNMEQLKVDVVMLEEEIKLREVIVKAPLIFLKGDTIRYAMGPFVRSEDATLEDGLKRIPGITVDESGLISFLGRNISHFYIEGLNMLGGRYNLATKNIPVDKVTGVEVLKHHQANKIDKDELSSNVALNIKLSEKAKIKPFGTYEGRAGLRNNKDILLGVGGTGMLFRSDFQMLATIKLANDGRMGMNELIDHFGSSSFSSSAEQVLPPLSGSRPPLQEQRYKDIRNEMISINTLKKVKEDVTLNVNADYVHSYKKHGYETESHYPAGDLLVVTRETVSPEETTHQAGINISYKENKENRLVVNTTNLRTQFQDLNAHTFLNDKRYGQEQNINALNVKNLLNLQQRKGKWRWHFNSNIEYTQTPQNELQISHDEFSSKWIQKTKSKTFYTKEDFHTRYQITPELAVTLPINFSLNYTNIETDLNRPDTLAINQLNGLDMRMSFAPYINYQSQNKKFRTEITIPMTFLHLNFKNKPNSVFLTQQNVFANPSLFIHYIINSKSEIEARTGLNHNYGDMLDLLTAPTQINYHILQSRSGILGKSKNYSANLYYQWQNPLQFWFFNAQSSYSRQWNNILRNQDLENTDISQTFLSKDNTSDRITASAKVSKFLLSWHTNISVGGNYNWYKSIMAQQGKPTTSYNESYSLYGEVNFSPVNLFQLNYTGRYSKNYSRNTLIQKVTDNQSHKGRATLRPTAKINIYVTADYTRTELISNVYKKFTLLDAGIEYKIKKVKLKLEMNNLLDKREYAYTIYDALNSYSYNYRLQGREFLLSISFM